MDALYRARDMSIAHNATRAQTKSQTIEPVSEATLPTRATVLGERLTSDVDPLREQVATLFSAPAPDETHRKASSSHEDTENTRT
eukprot:5391848-Pleurochrysis_carterae.AAC.1